MTDALLESDAMVLDLTEEQWEELFPGENRGAIQAQFARLMQIHAAAAASREAARDRGRLSTTMGARNAVAQVAKKGNRVASIVGGIWTTEASIEEAARSLLDVAELALAARREVLKLTGGI